MCNSHKEDEMTSFLITKKDNKSYEEKLSSAPESTKRNKAYAVQVFERFCQERYEKNSEDIIKEIIKIKQDQLEEYENALYGMLQEWINWNKKRKIGSYTIRTQFSNLRKYLFHMGVKTNEQDIKEYLTFEKISREERYPLSTEEYRVIVEGFSKNQLGKIREMLDELKSEQIILGSHEKELETYVDNIFQISKQDGISKIVGMN